ncbi:MAG: polymerase, sigma-24 subunit, subfamily [Phycisphaerales bacterium]|jgi:RNA polymerase sigma-70 factor (ECF subfamily)|nr:polymerase, sigma-24 subunit, subfamily [Phycisphaerales bacterium]
MQAQKISRNFPIPAPSNPMSSLSGSQFEVPEPSEPINLAARREIELLRKAQQGDRASYGELVVAYQDRLYNAVLRLVGDFDEARELTQEAFTRGLMKLESFRGDASPYTWLFRIAVNLAISHLRKVQRHRVFSLDAPPRNGNGRQHDGDDQASSLADRVSRDGTSGKAAAAMPPDDLERKELHGQVLTALGRLDAEYRAVLVMRDIEGFDYQQMADVLGLPLGTLKSRLFRARLALRDELRAYLSADRRPR